MTRRLIVGLDIGGANLKAVAMESAANDHELPTRVESWASRIVGTALVAFELWRHPEDLPRALRALLHEVVGTDPPSALAVTMTGELADGYPNRRTGVSSIVRDATQVSRSVDSNVWFYTVDGHLIDADRAIEVARSDTSWWTLAASNWHASASLLGRTLKNRTDRGAWMIDIGSTTTDIVHLPWINAVDIERIGRTDAQRLRRRSLVYVGSQRTPVASLIDEVAMPDGPSLPIMREFFATIDDCWRVLSPRRTDNPNHAKAMTADGRGRSASEAATRLARMIGVDVRVTDHGVVIDGPETFEVDPIERLATQCIAAARLRIAEATARIQPTDRIVLIGHGDDRLLPRRLQVCETLRVAEFVGVEAARGFPAFAAAMLATETGIDRNG